MIATGNCNLRRENNGLVARRSVRSSRSRAPISGCDCFDDSPFAQFFQSSSSSSSLDRLPSPPPRWIIYAKVVSPSVETSASTQAAATQARRRPGSYGPAFLASGSRPSGTAGWGAPPPGPRTAGTVEGRQGDTLGHPLASAYRVTPMNRAIFPTIIRLRAENREKRSKKISSSWIIMFIRCRDMMASSFSRLLISDFIPSCASSSSIVFRGSASIAHVSLFICFPSSVIAPAPLRLFPYAFSTLCVIAGHAVSIAAFSPRRESDDRRKRGTSAVTPAPPREKERTLTS